MISRTLLGSVLAVTLAGTAQAQMGPTCNGGKELATPDGGWLESAGARLGGDPELETGARADPHVKGYQATVCADRHVATWLVATCEPFEGTRTLVELRRRIARDLMRAPGSVLARMGVSMTEKDQRAHLLAVAVLDTLLTGGGTRELGGRIARYANSGLDTANRDLCLVEHPPSATASKSKSPMLAVGRVLELVGDIGKTQVADAQWTVQIEQLLAKEGRAGADGKLSPPQQTVAASLLRDVRELERSRRQLADPGDTRRELALSVGARIVRVVQDVVGLVEGGAFAAPRWLPAEIDAVMEGRLADAQAAVEESLLVVSAADPIPKSALEALRLGIQLGMVKDEKEAKTLLGGLVAPVGPWTGSFLFEASGAVLLAGGGAQIGAGLLLGLNERTWGFAADGSMGGYSLAAAGTRSTTHTLHGGLELWGVIAPDQPVKGEMRVGLDGWRYASKLIDTGTSTTLSEETSLGPRASLLVGLRVQPSGRFAAGLWLGGGAQYELYDAKDPAVPSDETAAVLLRGRLRLEYQVAPRLITTRLRVDVDRHRLHRDTLAATATSTERAVAADQLEIGARLHIDGEIASFAGLVPGLVLGADSVSLSPVGGASASSVVPAAGISLRSESF